MLLGLDRVAMAGGGLSAKSYVQTDLVSLLDGIENVGFGSQDKTATVWKDLVGSLDFEVQSGSEFGDIGLVSANGGKSAIASAEVPTCYCMEIAFTLSTYSISYFNCLFSGSCTIYNRSPRCLMFTAFINQCRFYLNSEDVRWKESLDDGFHTISCNYDKTTGKSLSVFVDGVEINSYDGSDYENIGSSVATFGGNSRGLFPMQFGYTIHGLRLYSDHLTAAKIAANYAVDKARFGLT